MKLKALVTSLALMLVVGFAAPSHAQVVIDNTTLSAAITTTGASTVTLAAVTCTGCTFGPDTLIYVDREAMRVTGAYSAGSGVKFVPVRRGSDGTLATTHKNAAVVYYGPGNRFKIVTLGTPGNGDPAGPCTRAQIPFLPWINVLSGNIWNCNGSNVWTGINSMQLVYNSAGPLGAQ